MKVLLTSMGMDIGGAETHVLNLALGLSRRGVEPVVVSNGGVYERQLAENGIEHISAPLNVNSPGSLLKSSKIIKKALAGGHFDLLHAHGRIPALASRMAKGGLPCIVTAHARLGTNPLLSTLSYWGDETISVSLDIANHLVDLFGVRRENITIISNGIDLERFRADENANPDPGNIIYLSRLDESLGEVCAMTMKAVSRLAGGGIPTELNIVGDGSRFSDLSQLAQSLAAEQGARINMLGKRTDIPELLRKSELAVCVSRSAMEAMACERPVILAGGEGYMGILGQDNTDEALYNNFTGRGCGRPSVEALAADIKTVLSGMSEQQRAEAGRRNRSIIKEHYSLDLMVDKTLKVYSRHVKEGAK